MNCDFSDLSLTLLLGCLFQEKCKIMSRTLEKGKNRQQLMSLNLRYFEEKNK